MRNPGMADYELQVETDATQHVARFKLSRADRRHLAANEITLPEHSTALWEGLFDTRRYIERYEQALIFEGQTEPATAELLLQRLGEFLGEQVLGQAIIRELAAPGRHVLVVHLPTPDQDVLAAAFARVPWEIARLADGTRVRNLVVRAVTTATQPGDVEVTDAAQRVAEGEPLRLLAVFAEAPGARPLAMRLEREQLRTLFAEHILPHRNVELDILCHLDAFRMQLRAVPDLETLLDEIVQAASHRDMTAGQRADPGTVALSLVALAALWKLLSVGIETLRSMAHDAALQRRVDLIRDLQDLGYDRQAPFILERLQHELRKRPEDDPMIKALIKLFGA
jgi:hypothetical protein